MVLSASAKPPCPGSSPGSPPTNCVSLAKLLNSSKFQLPLLLSGDESGVHRSKVQEKCEMG